MSNNGLIATEPGFVPSSCFSGPVQCPAAASDAYKNKQDCSYSIPTYNRICLQHTAGRPGHGGCGRSPIHGQSICTRPLPKPAKPAPPQPADADGTRQSAHESPKHASKPQGA